MVRASAPRADDRIRGSRAEHRQTDEDLDEQAVVQPVSSRARVIDRTEDADSLEQPGEALRGRGRAGRELLQRSDEHRQLERLAVDLANDAAARVDDRGLRQVVEAGAGRRPYESGVACERIDGRGIRAEELPVRKID